MFYVDSRHWRVVNLHSHRPFPPQLRKKIKPLINDHKIRQARCKRLKIFGTIRLALSLESKRTFVNFRVAEILATSVILGCDFSDHHMKAIRPRKSIFELDDGATVPIVLKKSSHSPQAPPLPEDLNYFHRKGRPLTKFKCTNALTYHWSPRSGSP